MTPGTIMPPSPVAALTSRHPPARPVERRPEHPPRTCERRPAARQPRGRASKEGRGSH